jgi:hypothetical protein
MVMRVIGFLTIVRYDGRDVRLYDTVASSSIMPQGPQLSLGLIEKTERCLGTFNLVFVKIYKFLR